VIAQVTFTRERQTSGNRFLSSCTAGSDRVVFVYVPGGSTQGAFAAFLRDDDALFRRLGQSRIRYCSTSPDVARKARGFCYRRYQTMGLAMHPALTRPGDPIVRRDGLLHFEARRRFEARALHTFSQGDLDRPRKDLRRFSGDWWHGWYQRWCADGDQAAAPDLPSLLEPSRTSPIECVEERLRHAYPLCGGPDAAI